MEEREGKLERHFRNANRFMWGLSGKNQKETYLTLNAKGFSDNGTIFRGSYSTVSKKLVDQYGIEKILLRLIKSRIEEIFDTEYINFLRKCWKQCIQINLELLRMNELEKFVTDERYDGIFLHYNKQYDFVEGWGELASIWFEEIEPFLDERKDDK